MAAAILAFFASAILFIHLSYDPGGPAAAPNPPGTQGPPLARQVPTARQSKPAPDEAGALAGPASPAPAAPAPAAGASGDRARDLAECVERTIRAAGSQDLKPLPGRLKRAREELRGLRARTACEQELADASAERLGPL